MPSHSWRDVSESIWFRFFAILCLVSTMMLLSSMKQLVGKDIEKTARMRGIISSEDLDAFLEEYKTAVFFDDPEKEAPTIFFGIKAGAHEIERRETWRASDCAAYYAKRNVAWKFMVGRPLEHGHDLSGHNQGGLDTEWERLIEGQLLEENEVHGDMVMLPMRDQYMALPDKLVNSLEYAWWNYPNAAYIGTHDVEYCVDMAVVLEFIDEFENENQCPNVGADHYVEDCPRDKFHDLYAGNYYWSGSEYESMAGAEGLPKPYFSGSGYFISRHLVGFILFQDRTHTVLNGYYGSVADDVDAGKWVAYANETHGIRTAFKSKPMVVNATIMNWDNQSVAIIAPHG